MSGSVNPTDLVSLGSREGDESAKPKEYFSWEKPGHSKSEYRYFPAVRKKRLAQQDKAGLHTVEDPEMGKTEFLGERGTSVLSIIPERDVCLAYPCPSPLIKRGSDDLEDLMVLACQVWFDAEAPEAFERDDLDTTATTEQHLRTLAQSEVQIESNTSVGTQISRRRVRREKRDGSLRSKSSFSELRDQKSEYVTHRYEQCVSKSQVRRDRWTDVRSKSRRRGE